MRRVESGTLVLDPGQDPLSIDVVNDLDRLIRVTGVTVLDGIANGLLQGQADAKNIPLPIACTAKVARNVFQERMDLLPRQVNKVRIR